MWFEEEPTPANLYERLQQNTDKLEEEFSLQEF
jgi:hypothetical protein